MSKVLVGVRIKPVEADVEKLSGLLVDNSSGTASMKITVSGLTHEFNFDQLYPDNALQQEVFETSGIPIISQALEGYNGCIFAFGQTGIA